MGDITPIGNGFDNPRAMLISILDDNPDIEWVAISYETPQGRYSNYTNGMTLSQLALVACSWLGLVHRFEDTMKKE